MELTIKIAFWAEGEPTNLDYVFKDCYFEENKKLLDAYFNSNDELEVKVVNDLKDSAFFKDSDFYEELPSLSLATKFLLNDLKDDDSAISKYMKESSKYESFILILEKMTIALYHNYYGDDRYTSYYAYYNRYIDGDAHCSAYITKKYLLEKYGYDEAAVFEKEFVKDYPYLDFIEGVVSQYYLDLGRWDREFVRNDSKAMATLTKEWIDILSIDIT